MSESVLENTAFPQSARRRPFSRLRRAAERAQVDEWIERLDVRPPRTRRDRRHVQRRQRPEGLHLEVARDRPTHPAPARADPGRRRRRPARRSWRPSATAARDRFVIVCQLGRERARAPVRSGARARRRPDRPGAHRRAVARPHRGGDLLGQLACKASAPGIRFTRGHPDRTGHPGSHRREGKKEKINVTAAARTTSSSTASSPPRGSPRVTRPSSSPAPTSAGSSTTMTTRRSRRGAAWATRSSPMRAATTSSCRPCSTSGTGGSPSPSRASRPTGWCTGAPTVWSSGTTTPISSPAAERVLATLSDPQLYAFLHPLDAEEWRAWSNPEFVFHRVGLRLEELDGGPGRRDPGAHRGVAEPRGLRARARGDATQRLPGRTRRPADDHERPQLLGRPLR